MGGGTFGLAAAADFYFGKNIKDLSLAEAAMLAGLFKAPTKYAPHINLPAARARANVVLDNLVDAGFMKVPLQKEKEQKTSEPDPPKRNVTIPIYAIRGNPKCQCRKVPAEQVGHICATVISRWISSDLNPIASAARTRGSTATS